VKINQFLVQRFTGNIGFARRLGQHFFPISLI